MSNTFKSYTFASLSFASYALAGDVVPTPTPSPPSGGGATSVIGGGGGSGISLAHAEVRYSHPPLPPLPELSPESDPVQAPSVPRRKTGRGRLRPRHVAQPKREASPLSWIGAPAPKLDGLTLEEVRAHWVPKAKAEGLQVSLTRALEELRAGEANHAKALKKAAKAAKRAAKRAARAERRAAALAGLPAKVERSVVYVEAGETWQPVARAVAWTGLGAGAGVGVGLFLPTKPAWLRPAVVVVGALAGALFGLRR